MKRILVDAVAEGPRLIRDEAYHHLARVLRARVGDEVVVFDGEGREAEARVTRIWPTEILLHVGSVRAAPAAPVAITLIVALLKGEKMDLVVQKAVELGASRVVPFASERAVPRLEGQRGTSRAERWRRIAQEAARQSGRADVPQVDAPVGWEGLFSLAHAEPDRRPLLLDPDERELRLGAASSGVSRLLLVVGPEGGFSPEERQRAVDNGFLPVALGPFVLRTETSGLAALAVVMHVHGALG